MRFIVSGRIETPVWDYNYLMNIKSCQRNITPGVKCNCGGPVTYYYDKSTFPITQFIDPIPWRGYRDISIQTMDGIKCIRGLKVI